MDSIKLIDQYLPCWDFAKSNQILLNNKEIPERPILDRIDFSKSGIIRILFLLRGMPTKRTTLDSALRSGFILLDENQSEIVLGLIAQPWKFNGNILHTTPDSFSRFEQSDFIKAAWNFRYERKPDGLYLTTETRVHCTSKGARKKFSMYWFIIGYFSGVIRNEMLKLIKQELSKETV